MSKLRYYLDLYRTYMGFVFKTASRYKADTMIFIVSSFLHDGSTLLFLAVIFSHIAGLEGWSFHEMLMIWGLGTVARNIENSFFNIPARIYEYVQSGDFDRLFVRPPGMLFQIAGSSGVYLASLGRIAAGITAMAIALPSLSLPWWCALYIPLVIVSGTLLQFAIEMFPSCLGFWFTNTRSIFGAIVWSFQFGQYPAGIFALPLRIFITWIIPYAMIGFYPVAFMLRSGEYLLYGIAAPLMGFSLFAVSLLFWKIGLRHYQSTGS
jgi:ABC-2 type transport system permease protein